MELYGRTLLAILGIISLTVPLALGELLATDPGYVPKVEASMAAIIREHLGVNGPGQVADLFKLVNELEQRSQEHSHETFSDPIRLFRIVRSLVDEWKEVKGMLKEVTNEMKTLGKNSKLQVPRKQDVQDIVGALLRIQETYRLNTKDIAAGVASGLDQNGTLSARDCLDIGLIAFEKSDFYHALNWLQEAGAMYETEAEPTISAADVLAPLTVAMEEQGNHGHAIRAAVWLAELLDSGEGEKEEIYKKYPKLEKLIEEGFPRRGSLFRDQLPPAVNERSGYTTGDKIYMALCRGEVQKPKFTDPRLKCYYERSRPRLKLAPAKVELVHDDPPVKIFRGIISLKEIGSVQKLVKDKLQRSKVEKGDQQLYTPEQRTSSTGYLSHYKHNVVSNIRRRVGEFTGLSMERAEQLQIARYPVGGHYGPHYDHATAQSRTTHGFHGSFDEEDGDRIATVMFYLSEPIKGGATVFPYLDLSVSASRGDAIFWYNLRKSGKDEMKSIHAGCPVVSGDKWIANQWIKEGGQEFLRRCALSEDR